MTTLDPAGRKAKKEPLGLPVFDDEGAGSLGLFTVIVLVLEFMTALWARGVVFTAVLFGLMSVIFAAATLASYFLARRAVRREQLITRTQSAVRALFLIGLVSSACIALLAGIFSLPLLFNAGWGDFHPEWRIPAVSGFSGTAENGRLTGLHPGRTAGRALAGIVPSPNRVLMRPEMRFWKMLLRPGGPGFRA